MSSVLANLETKLGELYKSAPNLPEKYRKLLVDWVPWLSLAAGVLSLWAAWMIWHWVHLVAPVVDYLDSISAYYRTGPVIVATNHWSLMLWVSIIVLLAEAVIYLLAFPGLRAKKKNGWDMLFYGALLNIAYGIAVLFTSYGGFGQLIGTVIGTAVGLYFLYQVRSYYTGSSEKRTGATPAAAKSTKQ